ncbi:FG-GAP repeat domain-containing protein [Streptomyces sp. NPDC056527]|uniref:FG-GAP repeat domain-containing protein n=1 Tax=Streptomyces sp. NPDC056527 TaxID=3345853 RepID=UPI003697BD9B
MSHARPARRRLAAAVVTVLTVTVGSTGLTVPAVASPAGEGTTDVSATQDVIPFPRNMQVYGVTSTGYLTVNPRYLEDTAWIRASDGSSVAWRFVRAQGTGLRDIVATRTYQASRAVLTDLATGEERLSVYLGSSGVEYAGAAGEAIFTMVGNASGGKDLRMHTRVADRVTTTGIPADATSIDVRAGTPDHALLTYSTGTGTTVKKYVAMLDLATNAVTETYELPAAAQEDLAVSATHLAWVESGEADQVTVVVVDRSTGTRQRMGVGVSRGEVEVGLVGDWVTYGMRGGLTSFWPNALYALTARSLKDGTTTHKLLDHVESAAAAPDGAQVVRGGTVEQGEGIYRITPGADGVPTTTLVGSTGEPTKVTLLGHKIPSTIDLDQNQGTARLEWTVSRLNVQVKVTLRHVRTGLVKEFNDVQPANGVIRFDWMGDLSNLGRTNSAYNGDYTWHISVAPMNGIGPTVTSSGTFTVTRKPAPHDYNDNGSPDLLLRDGSGRLWDADSHYDPYTNGIGQLSSQDKLIGSGWGGYSATEAAGNIGGAAHADLIARDTTGALWLYLGNGDGTLATRYKIATGFGGYNKIAAGSDLNGDGKADLVATDAAGAMWLYKGTGNWRSPYTTRVKISTGWNGYNQITATGNIAGGAAGDLVARDSAGVLWLYLGNGDGTFATRVKIGSGWGGYSHIVGIGDADRDGRPDLFATNSADRGAYLYKGTGSWRAPFGARQEANVAGNRPTSVA